MTPGSSGPSRESPTAAQPAPLWKQPAAGQGRAGQGRAETCPAEPKREGRVALIGGATVAGICRGKYWVGGSFPGGSAGGYRSLQGAPYPEPLALVLTCMCV